VQEIFWCQVTGFMKHQRTRIIRGTLAGGACGFLFMFLIILLPLGGTQPPGEENMFNAAIRTINAPVLWLADGAMGNTPTMILSVCAYWALLGAVAGGMFSCFCRAVRGGHAQPMEEPEKPTDAAPGNQVLVAVIGGAGAFVLACSVFLFKLAEPSQNGERSVFGNIFRWLSMPAGWAMEWAVQQGLAERENIPLFLGIYFSYWIGIGLVIALATYRLQRGIRRRNRRFNESPPVK
jgi:hypothetical protein